MSRSTRLAPLAGCIIGLFLLSSPALAGSIDIFNAGTRVGTLQFTVDAFANEYGYFTLLPQYRGLMSDALGLQFRFFQVIYYDDEPVTWNSGIITPARTAAHSGTIVDTPAGGWDYQYDYLACCHIGGDDNSPFYESDTEANPATGILYRFPTLSYPALHTADSYSPGTVRTEDGVGLSTAGDRTLFETYLTFMDPALSLSHTFDVLGGYSWGITALSSVVETGIGPIGIPSTSITSDKIVELQAALNRSGFGGDNAWTVQALDTFYAPASVPEPVPAAMLLTGGILLLLGRKRIRG